MTGELEEDKKYRKNAAANGQSSSDPLEFFMMLFELLFSDKTPNYVELDAPRPDAARAAPQNYVEKSSVESAKSLSIEELMSGEDMSQFTLGNTSREKPLIVLDVGHGYFMEDGKVKFDPGAVVQHPDTGKDITEYDLNVELAEKTKSALEERGWEVKVVMGTQENPLPNRYGSRLVDEKGEKVMHLSIHHNASESSQANGARYYYDPEKGPDSYNALLAANLTVGDEYSTNNELRSHDTVVIAASRHGRNDNALGNTVAALVEGGFMTNKTDLRRIISEEGQNKTAESIAEAATKSYEAMQAQASELPMLMARADTGITR